MVSFPPLAEMVTFSPNKNIPIHRWFYYREGFSKTFVEWAIQDYSLEGPVLDPFCGVGTTLLACKENDLESIGSDVSPLARFVSETKTRNYDLAELQSEFSELKKHEFHFPREGKVDSWVAKRFHNQTFRELLVVKKFLDHEYKKSPLHDLALLALIDSTLRASNVERMGASLRRSTNKGYKPIKKFWFQKLEYMLKDLKKAKLSGPEPTILNDDARQLKHVRSESISSIITSPPYLNKIEYASAYKLELALFFEEPTTQLRSFVGKDVRAGGESDLPIVDAYLSDMERVLKQFHRILLPDGKAVINVAGGAFPDRVVNSDELLVEKSEELGFEVIDNIVARTIDAYQRHSGFVGKVNERVFVLEKRE
jgi:DNA modification methylase